MIPRPDARETVVLFHGHAASKDSQLREAKAFHGMAFNALLVDFYGSGGSGGNGTSIGFYEALDVTQAFGCARGLPRSGPVVLYGTSMGAAAVLKAVADDKLQPAALILECPFDSLIGTVRHRFTSRGVPSFPLADLLVFWGGAQEGFNGFRCRRSIQRPALRDRRTCGSSPASDTTRAFAAGRRSGRGLSRDSSPRGPLKTGCGVGDQRLSLLQGGPSRQACRALRSRRLAPRSATRSGLSTPATGGGWLPRG